MCDQIRESRFSPYTGKVFRSSRKFLFHLRDVIAKDMLHSITQEKLTPHHHWSNDARFLSRHKTRYDLARGANTQIIDFSRSHSWYLSFKGSARFSRQTKSECILYLVLRQNLHDDIISDRVTLRIEGRPLNSEKKDQSFSDEDQNSQRIFFNTNQVVESILVIRNAILYKCIFRCFHSSVRSLVDYYW